MIHNEVLYQYGAKFRWQITILIGIFLMIFGIDLLISLIESYNIYFLFILSGIYGIGTILILIGLLGIFIVKRYGRTGDLIFQWSIIISLSIIPIVFFLAIPNGQVLALICVVYLLIFVGVTILDAITDKRRRHVVNPEDEIRIFGILANIIWIIAGIIIAVAGIAVNGFFLEYLSSIYKLGSYGLAFMVTGAIMVGGVIFETYHNLREKREKEKIVTKKREEFNIEWFKQQHFELGKSIQDIANELNESVMSIKKRLEDLEYSEELNEVTPPVKKDIQRNKIQNAVNIEKVKIIEKKKEKIVEKKREDLNVDWVKHQYYDLGKSIQDIADQLNESIVSIRKILDDLENSNEFRETNLPVKTGIQRNKTENAAKIETVILDYLHEMKGKAFTYESLIKLLTSSVEDLSLIKCIEDNLKGILNKLVYNNSISIKNVVKKRKDLNVDWVKHQYYELGRSIQDIAGESNESVISIRKKLDDLEDNEELNEGRYYFIPSK